jgi:hypothetical protein
LHALATHSSHLSTLSQYLDGSDKFVDLDAFCDGGTYFFGLGGHFRTRATIEYVNGTRSGTQRRPRCIHRCAAAAHYRDVTIESGSRL